MLKDSAIVAGGTGLIGRAVVVALEKRGVSVFTGGRDLFDGITVRDLKNKGLCNIFVNCAYPKDWIEHLQYFQYFTLFMAELMKKEGGCIINLASIYGIVAPDFRSYEGTDMGDPVKHAQYSAVKAGIIAMSRTYASYYGKYRVRINCIASGGVFDNQPESFVQSYCDRTLLGRMATPEDVARAVVYLAEDEYMTGQTLILDGGLTVR